MDNFNSNGDSGMRITREAINELYPNTAYVIKNDSVLEILDDTVVSYEDIVQKVAELEYQEEVNEYQRQRAAEYPPYDDQFDKIYHSGINAWKSQIKQIKDKYPKQTIDATELQTRKDKAIFDLQTKKYIESTERLSQYKLSEGRPEVKDENDVVTQTAIEPLESTIEVSTTNPETMEVTTETVPNPAIVKDEEERAAAQSVVDATPQSVIDSINN